MKAPKITFLEKCIYCKRFNVPVSEDPCNLCYDDPFHIYFEADNKKSKHYKNVTACGKLIV